MPIKTPRKPFAEYKWRWAEFTPTESLNKPPVFLGVLRALRKCEGYMPNSPEFLHELTIIQRETNPGVNLVRQGSRNLIRNSARYWKAFDLLQSTRGGIQLTNFGQLIADGKITPLEFAVTTIKTFELPNRFIFDAQDIEKWGELKIKPLELLLDILTSLEQTAGRGQAYITPTELVEISIPIAGEDSNTERHIEAILLFRQGNLDINDWPNCAPEANDRRMAREFLLFLANYEFCKVEGERYYINHFEVNEVEDLRRVSVEGLNKERTYERLRRNRMTVAIERKRVLTLTTTRPAQAYFRDGILNAYSSTCIITGVSLPAVLEAAHIIPVTNDGSDNLDNGLCLRADIHKMFDTGHLRIDRDGRIFLSDSANLINNYHGLPNSIRIPEFVSRENIEWRWNYA